MKEAEYLELVEKAKAGALTEEEREALDAEGLKRTEAVFAAQAPKAPRKSKKQAE